MFYACAFSALTRASKLNDFFIMVEWACGWYHSVKRPLLTSPSPSLILRHSGDFRADAVGRTTACSVVMVGRGSPRSVEGLAPKHKKPRVASSFPLRYFMGERFEPKRNRSENRTVRVYRESAKLDVPDAQTTAVKYFNQPCAARTAARKSRDAISRHSLGHRSFCRAKRTSCAAR